MNKKEASALGRAIGTSAAGRMLALPPQSQPQHSRHAVATVPMAEMVSPEVARGLLEQNRELRFRIAALERHATRMAEAIALLGRAQGLDTPAIAISDAAGNDYGTEHDGYNRGRQLGRFRDSERGA